MKYVSALAAFVFIAASMHAIAQTPGDAPTPQDSHPSTISVQSNLVLVPAMVRTKAGAVVYTLTANDFILTDDGVEQPLTLEADAGGEPLERLIGAPMNTGRFLRLAIDIVAALRKAHQRGLVHKDIKPANISRLAG